MDITRCRNCSNPEACQSIFDLAVGTEQNIVTITSMAMPRSDLTSEELIDMNADEIQINRDKVYSRLQHIGCSLTAVEIDQNIAALKG